MHNNVVSPKSLNVVFQRLSFAIQKERFSGTICCPSIFCSSVIIILYIIDKILMF
jgi:hypothetical protein